MATRKTTSRTTRSRTTRRTARRTATSSTRRRTTSGALYPRRRRSRPGLPTTIGSALGALVVTTLLDLSWPARVGVIVVVLVLGLAYVLWRNRAEIAAGATGDAQAPQAPAVSGPAPVDSSVPGPPPVAPTVAPDAQPGRSPEEGVPPPATPAG